MAKGHQEQREFLGSARSRLGDPYQWGAAGANEFDCSGLVFWAAQRSGIKGIPRTSEEQFKVGTPVAMNGLKPGDLIFFHYDGAPGDASHVAIYAGNGRVIEAPHTGSDVKYTPLSAFAGHILGARRILPNPAGQVQDSSAFAARQKAYYNQATGGMTAQQRLAGYQQAVSNLPHAQLQSAHQTLQSALTQPAQLQPQSNPLLPQGAPQPVSVPAVQAPQPAQPLAAFHQQLLKGG